MKFHTLVLEGDKEAEREKQKILSNHTKSAYAYRKWRESLPPLHNRSFYLCRMIEESLKGIVIDGSGKITICAHRNRWVSGMEKYLCDHKFKVSLYYLEEEEINAIQNTNKETEQMVIFEILKGSLLDIARRNQCSKDIMQKIQDAFEEIIKNNFMRKERIAKLSKSSKEIGLTAQIYRILSAEVGEGWYLEITNHQGIVLCQKMLNESASFVDRLGSRLYAKAEWRGDTFVILNRFDKEVFSLQREF